MGRKDIQPLRKRSDRKFIEELYRKYKRLMLFITRKYTEKEDEAEDIVQSSTEKLMGQIPKLRAMEEKAVAAYIVYTVKSVGADWCRARSRYRSRFVSLDEQEEEQVFEDTGITPFDEHMISQEAKARLKEVWPRLSEGYQLLLEGRYVWEMSDQELAERFHCKPSSIRMKLTRARRELRQLMEETEAVR